MIFKDDVIVEYRNLYKTHGGSLQKKAEIVARFCRENTLPMPKSEIERRLSTYPMLYNDAGTFWRAVKHIEMFGSSKVFIDADMPTVLIRYMQSGLVKLPSLLRFIFLPFKVCK